MTMLRSYTLAVFALAIAGCVKEDPLVVGMRDASVEASAPPPLVEPQPGEPDVDAPDCRHCNETLCTDTARGTLCRKNGPPSSARRLNALVDCVR